MTSNVRVTFLLRGIDPKALIARYNEGKTAEIVNPTKEKITLGEYKNPTTQLYTDDSDKANFCRKDKIGNTVIYESTNNKASESCHWCRKPQKDIKESCGLPVMVHNNVYYTDGYFCSLPCVYAHYRLYQSDPLYRDSEILIKHLFADLYPDQTLFPAPDWRLHVRNGGSLNDDDFYAKGKTFIYGRTSNFTPLRVEYRQHKRED